MKLEDLTPDQRTFLLALDPTGKPTPTGNIGLSTADSYAARQLLRIRGLITYNKRLCQWHLTTAGVVLRGKADWSAWG